MVWLRADYEFASTFSYRMPRASAQFGVGVPIPSPATIKLALVDTAIKRSGSIDQGRQIFDIVKTLQVFAVPPPRISRFRVFMRRLKPPHSSRGRKAATEPSTGVRDYFIFGGPMSVYVNTPSESVELITELLKHVRRFGTSDSLCYCICVGEEVPPENLRPRGFDAASTGVGGFVRLLADLTKDSQFDGFNPFGGDQRLANQDIRPYILPLTVRRIGETWEILKRIG